MIFWLGLVPVQLLLGNVWPALNPWLAFANGVAWVWRRLGQEWTPPLAYPERLGVWPGAFLLFCFAALELCYTEPGQPARAGARDRALQLRRRGSGWPRTAAGPGWSAARRSRVYFGLLARIAPFGERDGRLVVRVPLSGLAGREPTPGMLAFVAVMLGSVGFDGFSRSPFWQDLRADLEGPYIVDSPGTAELISTGLALAGLVGVHPRRRARLPRRDPDRAQRWSARPRPLAPEFLLSLVPIALVYAVAHYFTFLVIQGQYAISLASDPFGFGWDLFGTVDYAPNIAPFSPNTVWYVQVGALVAGHVAGLAVAHDRAVTILRERDALRSQYAMLALMVVYTVGGLWLLSRG